MEELRIETTKRGNIFKQLRESLLIDGKPCSLRMLSELMSNELGETVKYSHISELEVGKRDASLNELMLYHRFFRVSFEELLDLSEDSTIISLYERLRYLESEEEWKMKGLLDEIVSTDKGLALLFYLSEYMNGDSSEDSVSLLMRRLNILKRTDFPSYDYQSIRLTVDSEVE